MRIFIICCLILSGSALAVIVSAFIEHKKTQKLITELKKEGEKLRRYTRYQQKQIDDLREHNGKLYDENLELKRTMTLMNIPDFKQNW